MLDIVMPKAGMDIQEGRVIRWLKKEGDAVKKGEPIAEIETDKVVIEEESPIDGIMLSIIAEEGDFIPVTKVIAWVGEKGEVPPKMLEEKADDLKIEMPNLAKNTMQVLEEKAEDAILATPYAKLLAREKDIKIEDVHGSGEGGIIKASDVLDSRLNATPLAKSIAKTTDIGIRNASGSGFNGKILAEDLKDEPRKQSRVLMSSARRTIASRMLRAHHEIPPVTNTMPVDVTDLIELRRQVNKMDSVKLSINDFVIVAVANALEKHPQVNCSVDGEYILMHENINIGVAVGTDEALLVPVIKNADKMKIFEISEKAKEYASKSQSGKLTIGEMSSGSFTVTNLGMFGITNFTPIINYPESAILGVCAVEDKLQRIDGKIIDRKVMNLCLTYDHRVIDGLLACKFLNAVKEELESPAKLLF